MEAARVYKIKIRENILRQVIFTDRNLFIGLILIIIAIVWKSFENATTDIKFFLSLSLSGIALLLITIKIDRQLIIKILLRVINYFRRNKNSRF